MPQHLLPKVVYRMQNMAKSKMGPRILEVTPKIDVVFRFFQNHYKIVVFS